MHGLTRSARPDASGKLMDMRGFDPKWRDVPDFIIGITKEIWEDRQIRPQPPSPRNNSRVIAATRGRSPSELLGEDVTLVCEYTLVDEIAIWKQILLATC